jgi:hypothetical protein
VAVAANERAIENVSHVTCVLVEHQPAQAPLLCTTWPVFTAEFAAALNAEGEDRLTDQLGQLHIVKVCGCSDDFCQSFYTGPKPAGAYDDGHRNVCLNAPWPAFLVLDVVHDDIIYVEVLNRSPLC